MRKEYIKVALATSIITCAFTVVPIRSTSTVFTHTVQASTSIDKVDISGGRWDVANLQALKEATYGCGYMLSVLSVEQESLEKFGTLEGYGKTFKNGDDITSVIAKCEDESSYKKRKVMKYTIGSEDIVSYVGEEYHPGDGYNAQDIKFSQKSTSFKFTAPFTGQFRVRMSRSANMAVTIEDCEKGMLVGRDSFSDVSKLGYSMYDENCNVIVGEWYVVDVVKGKEYSISMYTRGSEEAVDVDMMFIKKFKTGKQYKEDKWNVCTFGQSYGIAERKADISCDSPSEKRESMASECLAKIVLKEKSKVTLESRCLVYYNGHADSEKMFKLDVYKKDTKSDTGYSLYKTKSLGTGVEVSKKIGKVSITLPKGVYYLRLNDSGYDFMFKYGVTAVK